MQIMIYTNNILSNQPEFIWGGGVICYFKVFEFVLMHNSTIFMSFQVLFDRRQFLFWAVVGENVVIANAG